MTTTRFGEVITAMVTPFDASGALDTAAAKRLARHLLSHGSDGLVLAGTTGEAPTLSRDEKLALFTAVKEEVGDDASLIAGTGSYDTSASIDLTKAACAAGMDACLVVTPYYSRPPQNGLLAHFTALADASSVPLMIYDIPGRTGKRVERPTMLELAAHERIVAVKDAVGDPVETAKLRGELDAAGHSDFEIYSGDDVLLMPHLAAGAIGLVSVCSHLIGRQLKDLFGAWNDGKVDEARRIYIEQTPLMATIMSLTSSPIPVKTAVGMLGLDVGEPRLPLVPATEEEKGTIRTVLERAGLL